ncbi:MAG: hypothetical protein KatS3mg003_1627 [Candidatus Nitrosocaldaceae archaeon]|nr:MAG: hypothetical protein KatS3mg003_0401 [Candidatus Nitrosocaldaceae archaeon]GIU72148.1 MAG: hypothetical protein KatS3mg003_1627 [Candidatus Nitrosocaldaceae archaeon]
MKDKNAMINGTLTNIYKKIEEAGVSGLRKTQIVKEFGKDAPNKLEELISKGMIYSAKKRNSIIYWTKENYAKVNTTKESNKTTDNNTEIDKKIKDIYAILNNINEKEAKEHAGIINALNSKLEALKEDTNNRIDTLVKEHNENNRKIVNDIENRLSSITNKLDTLTKSIDTKADTNKVTELENSLKDSMKDLEKEIKTVVSNLNKTENADLKSIQTKLNTLTKSINEKVDVNKIKELEDNLKNLTNTISKIDQYTEKINILSTSIEKLEKSIHGIEDVINKKVDADAVNKLNTGMKKLEYNVNALNSKLEALKEDTNNRIDTLVKEHNENNRKIVNDIENRLSSITNKLDTLTKSIDTKADTNKVTELENSLKDSMKRIEMLDKNITKISNNANDRLDRLLRQISGKADDIKVFEMERKLESLLQVEAKLSSLENMINILDAKINETREEIGKSAAIIRAELQTISNGNGTQGYDTLSLEQFKMEFDRMIAESSTSIGWIELAEIRKKICDKYGISKSTFYSLVSQLLDTYDDIYELSSGGSEGVTVRGLVHGFIRRI